jgi:hypothetical protein
LHGNVQLLKQIPGGVIQQFKVMDPMMLKMIIDFANALASSVRSP